MSTPSFDASLRESHCASVIVDALQDALDIVLSANMHQVFTLLVHHLLTHVYQSLHHYQTHTHLTHAHTSLQEQVQYLLRHDKPTQIAVNEYSHLRHYKVSEYDFHKWLTHERNDLAADEVVPNSPLTLFHVLCAFEHLLVDRCVQLGVHSEFQTIRAFRKATQESQGTTRRRSGRLRRSNGEAVEDSDVEEIDTTDYVHVLSYKIKAKSFAPFLEVLQQHHIVCSVYASYAITIFVSYVILELMNAVQHKDVQFLITFLRKDPELLYLFRGCRIRVVTSESYNVQLNKN